MRSLAVRVLDHPHIVRSECGIDLPAGHQWRKVAGAQLIDQRFAARPRSSRAIEAYQYLAHPIPRELSAAVGNRDRNLGGQDNPRAAQQTIRRRPALVGTHCSEVEPPLTRQQQRRIRVEKDLSYRMRKTIVQPSGHAVPKRPKMFGVSTAQVLWSSDVLWRQEAREEVVVPCTKERAVAVYSRFADDARLVNVVILKSVIHRSVHDPVSIVMTIGAARPALRDLVREDLLASSNQSSLGRVGKLGERVG